MTLGRKKHSGLGTGSQLQVGKDYYNDNSSLQTPKA
jgi:hypothetical protein